MRRRDSKGEFALRFPGYLVGSIAVTESGVVRPITTSPTWIFFSMSCLAIEVAA